MARGEAIGREREQRPRAGLRYLLAWGCIALFALYAKEQVLLRFGYPHTMKVLGLKQLGLLTKLSFYRLDLVVDFMVVPALLYVLVLVLRRPALRALVVALVGVLSALLIFAQLQAHFVLGRMMDYPLAREAVEFYFADPEVGAHYTGVVGKASKLGLLVALSLLAVMWAWRSELSRRPRPLLLHRRSMGFVAVVFLACVALSFIPVIDATRFHSSFLLECLQVFHSPREADAAEDSGFGEDPLRRYRELTGAPPGGASPPYEGAARDADVILLVLETMPIAVLDLRPPAEDLPGFQRLRARSFFGKQHYTTSPSSSRAVFALMTSWYPTGDVRDILSIFGGHAAPGLISRLRPLGYLSAAYSSTPASFEEDALTYRVVGFDKMIHPEQLGRGAPVVDGTPSTWTARLMRDEILFDKMLADLAAWIDEDQRYFATFLPQVSHAPWPESVGGSGPLPTVLERGRAMLELQDAWLGRLLDLLEEKGRLDHTIIVFTGDHGLRNHAEDPAFVPGQLAEETFHLPLVIHSPGALVEEVDLLHPTSHLDVAPTILSLLGVERELMLGSPVWDPRLAGRRSYFIGRHYLGIDGFQEKGQFCMVNLVFGGVQVADHFDFDGAAILPESSEPARRCARGVEDLVYFQHRLALHAARE